MRIQGFEPERGRLSHGTLVIGKDFDGSDWGMPYWVARGEEDGPTLVVDACVHGDEVEGAHAAVKLIGLLNPKEIKGTVVGIPVVNMPAFLAAQRGSYPVFERNLTDMNRIWPGKRDDVLTERIAGTYWEEIVAKAQYLITMHGGGSQGYRSARVIFDPQWEPALEMAKNVGWRVVQEGGKTEKPPGDAASVARHHGVTAVTLELGGSPARMPQEFQSNVDAMTKAVLNVARYLKMIPGEPELPDEWVVVSNKNRRQYNSHAGLLVPEPKLVMEAMVKKGDPLMSVVNLRGEKVDTIAAPCDGIVLGFGSQYRALPGDPACVVGRVLRVIQR